MRWHHVEPQVPAERIGRTAHRFGKNQEVGKERRRVGWEECRGMLCLDYSPPAVA